jgi:hypothetical protein
MTMPTHDKNPLPPEVRNRLNQIHAALLALHKELLDFERGRYEKIHGTIGSAGHVLSLVINDPWFQWLRPMTAVITQIDELLSSRAPVQPGAADALITQSRQLLTPVEGAHGFAGSYLQAIQESPGVASAHGEWRTLLQRLDQKN